MSGKHNPRRPTATHGNPTTIVSTVRVPPVLDDGSLFVFGGVFFLVVFLGVVLLFFISLVSLTDIKNELKLESKRKHDDHAGKCRRSAAGQAVSHLISHLIRLFRSVLSCSFMFALFALFTLFALFALFSRRFENAG